MISALNVCPQLETFDAEFKTHHYSLIALIDEDATLATEQETHDMMMMSPPLLAVHVHIRQVLAMSSTTPTHQST